MKPQLLFTFLLIFVFNLSFAQRMHLISSIALGKKTIDSVRSFSHVVIKPITSASAWYVEQYDARDTLMTAGSYKDSSLTTPHGRFKYYTYYPQLTNILYDYVHHCYDTLDVPAKNVVSQTGFFVDGKRAGRWYTYDRYGKVQKLETYDNDVLNGLWQSYDPSIGKLRSEGQYLNGKREGRWNELSAFGDTITTQIYHHGVAGKTISHINDDAYKMIIDGGKPDYNFIKELNRKLLPGHVDNKPVKLTVKYMFTLNKEGKLTDPYVYSTNNFTINQAIVDAILSLPNWKPAIYNGKPLELLIPVELKVTVDENKYMYVVKGQSWIDYTAYVDDSGTTKFIDFNKMHLGTF